MQKGDRYASYGNFGVDEQRRVYDLLAQHGFECTAYVERIESSAVTIFDTNEKGGGFVGFGIAGMVLAKEGSRLEKVLDESEFIKAKEVQKTPIARIGLARKVNGK